MWVDLLRFKAANPQAAQQIHIESESTARERDVIGGLTKQDNLVLRFCVVFLCKMEWCFIVAQVGMCFDFSRHWASILPGDRFNSMQLGSGVSLQHNL